MTAQDADDVAAGDPGSAADMCALTVGSLFSGIGGIDLCLERAGWSCRWQSEIDPYASKVLAKHWPHVPNLGDIKRIDWSTVERPVLVAGGFPCQPVSLAGQRLAQDDPRWLWPEFARCLRELRPDYAVMENVPGLLTAGMGDVLGDLAEIGYDTEWHGIPAAAVGAPHLRWRVFIVAYATGQGSQGHWRERRLGEGGEEVEAGWGSDVADTSGGGWHERRDDDGLEPALVGHAVSGHARRSGSDQPVADPYGPDA